jgi:hypothetical protein
MFCNYSGGGVPRVANLKNSQDHGTEDYLGLDIAFRRSRQS